MSQMKIKYTFFISISFLIIFNSGLIAQETAAIRDRIAKYKLASDLFDQNVYLAARYELDKFVSLPDQPNFGVNDRLIRDAKVKYVVAALRLNLPQAESELVNYIDQYYPDPVTTPAILELASHYYNDKRYVDAVFYYEKLNLDQLSELEMSEASFKKGYSLFVQKKFTESQKEFERVDEFKNMFYYPVNYYNGMSQYFLNDYVGAIENFKKAGGSKAYGSYVPYYLCQIFFAQKEYDQLISYSEPKIGDASIKNQTEIRLLLGQSYYAKNDFARALPHLEYYEANSSKLTVEEFYQLAFTQYKTGKFESAKKNFLELTNENSRLGQMANYYLADCYIKLEDKLSARAAFKKVSQMQFDKTMAEEATFNYGKISAELNFERESINVLIDIKESSPFYNETQTIINDILLNSGDYANSISIIESLSQKSKKIESTYQIVTLKRGKQQFVEKDIDGATATLIKSNQYPVDANLAAESQYWIAKIFLDKNDISRSIKEFDKYFKILPKNNSLPLSSSVGMANYYQGYNYIKLKKYAEAETYFKESIFHLTNNKDANADETVRERVVPDAIVRAGDCLFKLRSYADAKRYYDQAISMQKGSYVYALFQRANIEGLQGKPNEKTATLEIIRSKHKNSEYYDDALILLGDTYLAIGDKSKAVSAYNDLIYSSSKSKYANAAYLKLGLIAYNSGDIQGALATYKKVLANNPQPKERGEALAAIEEIYVLDLKQADKYIAFIDSIPGMELSSFSRDSLTYSISKNYYLNADYINAISSFTGYLTKFPNGFFRKDALYYRADCHNLQKNYDQALVDFESIIASGKSEYEERSLIKAAIISYNYTQDFTKALQFYKKYEALVLNESDKYQAQLGAMRSAFRVNNDSDTKFYSNKVIANKLANKDEQSSAFYYLGKTLFKENKLEESLIAFKNVTDLSNNNQAAESRYLIAEILFNQGKVAQAEQQCASVNQLSSNYPYWVAKSLILMSDIYVKNNDLINARAALEAVIENFKEDTTIITSAQNKLAIVKKLEVEKNRIKPKTSNLLELQNPNGGQ